MARNWQNCDFCSRSQGPYPDYFDRPSLVYKDNLVICIPGRHISSSRNAKQRRIKAKNKVECELRWFWRHLYFGCRDKLPRLQLGVLPLAVCVQTWQSKKCPLYFIFSVCYPVTFFFFISICGGIYIYSKQSVHLSQALGTFLGSLPGGKKENVMLWATQSSCFFLPCFNSFQAFSDRTELSGPV